MVKDTSIPFEQRFIHYVKIVLLLAKLNLSVFTSFDFATNVNARLM